MGTGVARVGDLCTGHGCFPPRAAISGSPNVFVNGIPVVRVDDSWANHTCGNNTHGGTTVTGSSFFFVNGKAVARIGDSISCGSVVAAGSGNVFIG